MNFDLNFVETRKSLELVLDHMYSLCNIDYMINILPEIWHSWVDGAVSSLLNPIDYEFIFFWLKSNELTLNISTHFQANVRIKILIRNLSLYYIGSKITLVKTTDWFLELEIVCPIQ